MANGRRVKLPGISRFKSTSKKIPKMPQNRFMSILKGLTVYILIGLVALIFFINLSGGLRTNPEVAISQVVSDIKDSKVQKITIQGDKVIAEYNDHHTVETRKEPGISIYEVLKNSFLILLKLLHPFMPFVTEEIWGTLFSQENQPLIISRWPR